MWYAGYLVPGLAQETRRQGLVLTTPALSGSLVARDSLLAVYGIKFMGIFAEENP